MAIPKRLKTPEEISAYYREKSARVDPKKRGMANWTEEKHLEVSSRGGKAKVPKGWVAKKINEEKLQEISEG